MAKMAVYFFTSGFIALGVATIFYLAYAFRRNQSVGTIGTIFAWIGMFLLGFSILFRTIVSGRGPFANMYEYSLAFGFAITLAYNLFERRYKYRLMGLFVLPVALAILAWVLTVPADIEPLVPALQNNLLLSVHVSVAIVAYGVFAVAFGAAIMYLIQGKGNRVNWLPPAHVLELVSSRAAVIGFPFLSLMIILGAYWADSAWGRYWGWDPKETSSLVTWFIYAAYLHARNLRGWRGSASAWILIAGFVATVFTYFGVNLLLPGLHSYAGVG